MTSEYLQGVETFLDIAFERVGREGLILCPCKKYVYGRWCHRGMIKDHLICDGLPAYGIKWQVYRMDDDIQIMSTNVDNTHD